METTPQETVTVYTVIVPGFVTSLSGRLERSANKTFRISAPATILGCCRAVDQAVGMASEGSSRWVVAEGYSPDVTPNAAELGWPVGF